jgi:hypothetical protein
MRTTIPELVCECGSTEYYVYDGSRVCVACEARRKRERRTRYEDPTRGPNRAMVKRQGLPSTHEPAEHPHERPEPRKQRKPWVAGPFTASFRCHLTGDLFTFEKARTK